MQEIIYSTPYHQEDLQMENSKIAWTDHTFNPWIGCTKVSPGCANCYAKTLDDRHQHGPDSHWGPDAPPHITSDSYWRQPRKWDREAAAQGNRKRVFCASLADWADDEAPEGARERLWDVIRSTPHLDWLLLTKRAKSIIKYLPKDWGTVGYANVWLGVSCENREHGYTRVDILRTIPAVVRFISCEPLLEDISDINLTGIDWVIVGGESGNGSDVRGFDVAWSRGLHSACTQSGAKFFVKQMGTMPVEDGSPFPILKPTPDGKDDRHGRCLVNFPADLQVQEVPPGSELPSSALVGPFDDALNNLFRRAAESVITRTRHDDYHQRGHKAAETRRRNTAAKIAATTHKDGLTAEEFGRVLYWLHDYAESDAGVLTHLAQSAYASLTGMLAILNDITKECAA
jgi:protein gp37